MEAPKAKQIPHPHTLHGDTRPDDYYWLRDKSDPDVIAYLEAENEYYRSHVDKLSQITDHLYAEMVARIPESEQKVPVQGDAYFYYTRMEKSLQYPVHARKRAADRAQLAAANEEIILDLNELAGEGYLSVTEQRVSPDETKLAYLENRDGSDRYTLFVKNLTTGELLPDRIENVFIGDSVEWDATGSFLFYTTVDESQRPYRLWRHQLGDDPANDALLYEETDVTYTLSLAKSQSGRYLFLTSSTKTTTEVRYAPADRPLDPWIVFAARETDVEYSLEHWNDRLLVLTNRNRFNFSLFEHPIAPLNSTAMRELFPYDDSRYLLAVHPFREALVLEGRQGGLTQVWTYRDGSLQRLAWPEPLYSVHVSENRRYDTNEVLLIYESFLTPRTTYALHPLTGQLSVLQTAPISGPFDPDLYRQERIWATAEDGVQVPVSIVYKRDVLQGGPAPLLLYGYGSYGHNLDPAFMPQLLPMLDLGVVYAIGHVRGGSEMGRQWYENGKMLYKRNTFTDFIAVADDLIRRGYTTRSQLAADGRSAGGLLMGAVANLGGDRFAALSAGVPFVDVVTTMLDPTIPLTTLEWDEWGNPEDPEYYAYMKSYSPYDNVEPKPYPHLIVTTGINDPRVAYWEPAKWVARLRTTKTDDRILIMKTHMGAGHFGSSGRLGHIREQAEIYAFLLDKIGIRVH
ncbi:S9 family peptidase [Alicyclobacillus sacchari]|nr:S9 family peptidase [Alicyclobacillus sacchari]